MSHKVFLLDPTETEDSNSSSALPQFLKFAEERAGWTVKQAIRFQANMDAKDWFRQLQTGLEESDMIIGLGNFMVLYQTGDQLPAYVNLISSKLKSGCSVFLQGCAQLVDKYSPWPKAPIFDLLSENGIRIGHQTVASKFHDYQLHSSQLCCAFHQVDDCLLDPSLFDGVDTVWTSSSKLISYLLCRYLRGGAASGKSACTATSLVGVAR